MHGELERTRSVERLRDALERLDPRSRAMVTGIAATAVFALVFGYLVLILWNRLMPAVFGLSGIGYLQAFGIVILSKLIFGSVGGYGNGRHPKSGRSRQTRDFDWETFFDKCRGAEESEELEGVLQPSAQETIPGLLEGVRKTGLRALHGETEKQKCDS